MDDKIIVTWTYDYSRENRRKELIELVLFKDQYKYLYLDWTSYHSLKNNIEQIYRDNIENIELYAIFDNEIHVNDKVFRSQLLDYKENKKK